MIVPLIVQCTDSNEDLLVYEMSLIVIKLFNIQQNLNHLLKCFGRNLTNNLHNV